MQFIRMDEDENFGELSPFTKLGKEDIESSTPSPS
jgi:hypothetical protein